MYLDVDEELVSRFLAVLEGDAPVGRQKEQVVQDFLETNTEMIPTPSVVKPVP